MSQAFNLAYIGNVRIGHFIAEGFPIKGVIHVGANDGYEIGWYLKIGIPHIIGIEPLPGAFEKLRAYEQEVQCYQYGLGSRDEISILHPTRDGGFGSTFLEVVHDPGDAFDPDIKCEVIRLSTLIKRNKINIKDYNCLVIDVEGMELEVLKGCGTCLDSFDLLNIECRNVNWYYNDARLPEIVEFLKERGFIIFYPDMEVEDFDPNFIDDVLFVRKSMI